MVSCIMGPEAPMGSVHQSARRYAPCDMILLNLVAPSCLWYDDTWCHHAEIVN